MDTVPTLAPAHPPGDAPSWPVPAGGWDAHAHVFGPRDDYPLAPGRRYVPPTQTLAQYLTTLDRLGVAHGVLVQPSVYGLDNSCLLDALDQAPERLRGVIAADLSAGPTDELRAQTRRGVCGVRVAWTPALARFALAEQAVALAELGWHLDIRVEDSGHLLTVGPQLAELPVPVMVESMGSPAADEPDAPGFALMLDLITAPHVYAKLSHPYQI
jgi:predicted TIM-barrel fold metal-dependent hydrolase